MPDSDREIQRLAAVCRLRLLDTPAEPNFDRLTHLAARIFQVPIAFVALLDESRMWLKSCYGPIQREMDRRLTFCDHVLLSGQTIIVPDATRDERFAQKELVTRPEGIRFYAGVPLRSAEGYIVGTFCLIDILPRAFPPEQVTILQELAAIAVQEMENRLSTLRLAEEVARGERIEGELEARVERRTSQLAAANESLRLAEARARDIVEHAVEGIFQTTPEGRYLSANRSLAELYGYPSVEALLAGIGDIRSQLYVHPRSRDIFISKILADGQITGLESEVYRRDGSIIWISETARAVRDEEGQVRYFEGMVKDITTRKEAERTSLENRALLETHVQERTVALESRNVELRAEIVERRRIEAALQQAGAENSRLIAALQSSDAGVLISDPTQPDAPTIFINAAFERITGYTWDEAIGRNCRFLQGPETDPGVVAEIRDCVKRQAPFKGMILNYRRDGTPFWNELTINPVFDAGGRLVNFIGVQSDVTARVEAQARLLASEEALRESEERLQAILDQTTAFVYVSDPEGRYQLVNRRFDDVLGRPRESLLGRLASSMVDEETARLWRQNDRRVLAEGRPIEFEETMPLADGEHTYLSVKFPLRDRTGHVYALCGISTDITERKRQEELLRQSRDEAERANQAKSDFLSRMSHELRTPLNAILGFSQLLQMQPLETNDAENVEFISRAGHHLLNLINEVLDLARIESGRVALSPEPVEVAAALEDVLSFLRPLAAQRRIVLEPEALPGRGWHVLADPQRLRQILLNLLSNAVKYNRDGGTVTIRCRREPNSRLRIDVSDTGKGIPAEKMGRMFIPFERLGAELTAVEGSGIGLALSRRLARLQGGEIEARSEFGVGSTFSLRLPMTPGVTVTRLAPTAPVVFAPAAERHLQVLYIEDNVANAQLMIKLVARHPAWELRVAATGQEGLRLARELHPALILLDLQLPDLDGAAVLQRLRGDPELSGTPVIVVSADAMAPQAKRLLAAGAAAYLTKPIDVAEVLQLLDDYARAPVV